MLEMLKVECKTWEEILGIVCDKIIPSKLQVNKFMSNKTIARTVLLYRTERNISDCETRRKSALENRNENARMDIEKIARGKKRKYDMGNLVYVRNTVQTARVQAKVSGAWYGVRQDALR